MPDIFVGCFTYAVSRNPQNKMFLQIKRVRSERLSDLPKATQLVSGRVRIRTRSIGQYRSFMLQIVLVWHPLKKKKKKASLDFGLKRGSFYSDGYLHKGPEGIPREGNGSFKRSSGIVCMNVVNGLLGGNHCLKKIAPLLPQLSNNRDSCVSSQLKLAFWSFGSGASTGMNKKGSVSL